MFPWPTVWALGFWSNAKKKNVERFFLPTITKLHGFTGIYHGFTIGLPKNLQGFPEVLPGLGFSPQLRYCKWPADGPSQVEPGHLGSPKTPWRTKELHVEFSNYVIQMFDVFCGILMDFNSELLQLYVLLCSTFCWAKQSPVSPESDVDQYCVSLGWGSGKLQDICQFVCICGFDAACLSMTQKQFLSRLVTVIDFFLCGIDLNREEDQMWTFQRIQWETVLKGHVCLQSVYPRPVLGRWVAIFATVRLRTSGWRFAGGIGEVDLGEEWLHAITLLLCWIVLLRVTWLSTNMDYWTVILWNIPMNYLSMIYIYIWLLLTTMIFDISYCSPTIFLRQSPWILDSSYSWEILFLCVDSLHRLMLLISDTRSS